MIDAFSRVSDAIARKKLLMIGRSERLHDKFAMSKEMLIRLEAEKQRLLMEKFNEKKRQIEQRKEDLKRLKDAKVHDQKRRMERTREKALENERHGCAMAAEAFESKMRAVEQKKMELKEKEDRKHNSFRYKQIQARLRSEGVIADDGNLICDKEEDKMVANANGERKPREFKMWLHLFGREKREEMRRLLEKEKAVNILSYCIFLFDLFCNV